MEICVSVFIFLKAIISIHPCFVRLGFWLVSVLWSCDKRVLSSDLACVLSALYRCRSTRYCALLSFKIYRSRYAFIVSPRIWSSFSKQLAFIHFLCATVSDVRPLSGLVTSVCSFAGAFLCATYCRISTLYCTSLSFKNTQISTISRDFLISPCAWWALSSVAMFRRTWESLWVFGSKTEHKVYSKGPSKARGDKHFRVRFKGPPSFFPGRHASLLSGFAHHKTSPYKDVPCARFTFTYSSCGVLAFFNSMNTFKHKK